MRQVLRNTNPAETWLAERFQTNLALVNGQHIVVRFDLKSSGDKGYRFTAVNVDESFRSAILVDRTLEIGEYAQICAAIADSLNGKIDIVAQDALAVARESLLLLDALDAGRVDIAGARGLRLGEMLLAYGAHADRIWGNWLESLADHLKSL